MDVTENPGGTGAADNGIYWSGAHATAGNGGTRVELYAPPTFASGSSLSHIDASTSPDRLMNYSIGTNNERRTIDPLTTGMLLDIGWQGAGSATPEPGSFLLLGLAVGPILALRRRKQQAKRKAA